MTMNRTTKIAKNTLVQVFGRTIGTILGILTLGVMTRYLGDEGYGQFTTVTTFLQFFGVLVDFGLSLTTLSMLAEKEDLRDRIVSNMLTLRIISAAIFFVLAPLLVLVFPYDAEVKSAVAIGAVSFFFLAVNQILTAALQKELRMGRVALAEVLGRTALFGGALFVALQGLSLQWMIATLVFANFVTIFTNWLLVGKLFTIQPRFDKPIWKDIFTQSWPIGIAIVFNLIYLKGDVIILSLTRELSEVGHYGAAYKILDVVTVVPIMFMGLVLPLLVKARQAKENANKEFNRILQRAFDFMALLAFPLIAGGIAVGPELLTYFFTNEFDASGPLFQVLIIAAGAVFFGSMFGHAVIAVKKQKQMIWGYAIDAVLATILYLVLVPRHGATAAAWITVVAEVFIMLATYTMIYHTTRFIPRFKFMGKALFNAVLMAIFISYLPEMNVLFKVVLGAVIYAMLTLLTKTIPTSMIKNLIPGRGIDFWQSNS